MFYCDKQYIKIRLKLFFLLHESVLKVVYIMLYK